MSQCPDMRLKLETVIKYSKLGGNSAVSGGVDNDKSATGTGSCGTPASGTIKLKTDFSNFHTSSK